MARTYDVISFPVTSTASRCPVDNVNPALTGRVAYDAGTLYGVQFRCVLGHTWDVPFSSLPWYDPEHGEGARLQAALHLLAMALRMVASRLPTAASIPAFTPPTAPGASPTDPTLIGAYLNTSLLPYLDALTIETARAANAIIMVINALLQLTRE